MKGNFIVAFLANNLPEKILIPLKKIYYYKWIKKIEKDDDIEIVESLLSEGDTVLIVGASYGKYTKYCSSFVGKTGRVLSMEPVPETFELLSSNVKKMKFENVELFNYAMYDKIGKKKMAIPKYDWGGPRYYCANICDDGNIPIKTIKLDSLFGFFEDLRFIKVDGADTPENFIASSKKLIDKFQPILLLEVWKARNKKIFLDLENAGYRIYAGKDGNYFFAHKDDAVWKK